MGVESEKVKRIDLSEANIHDMVAIGHPPSDWPEAEKSQWYREAVEFSKRMQEKRREWEA